MRSNQSETSGAGHKNLQALAEQRVVRTIVIPPLSADGAIALDLSVSNFECTTRRTRSISLRVMCARACAEMWFHGLANHLLQRMQGLRTGQGRPAGEANRAHRLALQWPQYNVTNAQGSRGQRGDQSRSISGGNQVNQSLQARC